MATSVDSLVMGKVIGDVTDMFVPTINMSVYFDSQHVTDGCNLPPSMAANPPTVQIAGRPDVHYTLVMTDPDAPDPREPSMREWIHWIVVDIPGGSDTSQGREILPYIGPSPPTGIHRYALLLYKQNTPQSKISPPTKRSNFSTRTFAAQHGLNLPVAGMYFNSKVE